MTLRKIIGCNPHHAAALALVGWYLMVPPIDRSLGLFYVPATEPLSLWSIDRTFTSEDECNRTLADLRQSHLRWEGNTEFALDQQRQHSICIATDDPRLMETK